MYFDKIGLNILEKNIFLKFSEINEKKKSNVFVENCS